MGERHQRQRGRRILLDNYAAHKHPKVRAWLDRHERVAVGRAERAS
jgi:hypothetical protein